MKVSEVSFKGIKNVGGVVIQTSENAKKLRIVAELTDEGSKDLSEFTPIFKEYPNPTSYTILKLDYFLDSKDKEKQVLELNGYPLELNDKKFQIFSKITNLLKKIHQDSLFAMAQKKLKNSIPVDEDYIKSMECSDNFMLTFNPAFSEEQLKRTIMSIHSPTFVESSSSQMLDLIKERMLEYFNVPKM